MNRGIERAEHLFRRIIKLEEAICVVLQIIMLLICFAAVVKRYFFNAPWAWTDEIQLLLLVIYGYLAISIDVYRDNHVALTGMYKHLSKRGKVVLDLIRHVLLGGFFCLMTYYGWKVYGIKARKLLTVTHLSQGIVFMAQTICAALMVLYCLMNFVKAVKGFREASTNEV
ncbi:TRAP transporter small permease [Enterocloster asparagiformis]|uniref:TRAP transporter small permease n=1 Tax=Enterocloster asparagiformis TaxID=333367 RepID=UPI002A804595|nr:TRAP transporter small permease [Enterocloster asparagiformis]